MFSSAEKFILSQQWTKEAGFKYAVAHRRLVPQDTYVVLFFKQKPVYCQSEGWTVKGATGLICAATEPVKYVQIMDGWKSAIVTKSDWDLHHITEAVKPEPVTPEVGQEWMTSNGPVRIVYTNDKDGVSWRCCAEHKLGGLNIYGLEELKPMPPEVSFTKAVMAKLEEQPVDIQDLLIITAQLISAGKLDTELAALGYVPRFIKG